MYIYIYNILVSLHLAKSRIHASKQATRLHRRQKNITNANTFISLVSPRGWSQGGSRHVQGDSKILLFQDVP